MDGHDLAEVAGAIGIFALVTTVIAVAITQLGATWRAKAALAREQEYRTLADTATRAQEETAARLAETREQLSELTSRMTSVERVLKEVE